MTEHHPTTDQPAGVSAVTRLRGTYQSARPPSAPGPHLGATIPFAATQGTLALELDTAGEPPAAPELRLLQGGRAAIEAWAVRFAQAAIEVIAGDRGPQQLLRCTSSEVYADLVRRSTILTRAQNGTTLRRRLRATVRSVHVYCPGPGRAEISVHVRHGQRSRAMAARLEEVGGHWVCTALEFGPRE